MATSGLGLAMTFLQAKEAYFFIVRHAIAGPQTWSYFVPFVLLPAAIMVPPEVLSHKQLMYYFLLPIYASLFHAWSVMGCWDVISMDGFLWATYLLALEDPRVLFKRVRFLSGPLYGKKPEDSNGKLNGNGNGNTSSREHGTQDTSYVHFRMDNEIYPKDIFARLRWTINLVASDRMARWITGNPRHDAKQYEGAPSRLRWFREIFPSLFAAFFFMSLTTLLAHHDPWCFAPHRISIFSPYGPTLDSAPLTVRLLHQYIPSFIVRALSIGFYAWSIITFGFGLLAPPLVYLNYLTGLPPDNWSLQNLPPYFGSFTHGVLDNGVRGLWGSYWHSHLKQMVLTPGRVTLKVLGLDQPDARGKKHWVNAVLPLAGAFVFSGIIHMGLVPPSPAYTKSGLGPWSLRLRIASVFWVQPLGIAAEMGLAMLVKSVVPKRFKDEKGRINEQSKLVQRVCRMGRLAWVLTWLCCCSPLFAIPFSDLGYWNMSTAAGRFPEWVRWFTGGGWFP